MYKRNCQICNTTFETKSQHQRNCVSHKGLFKDRYFLIDDKIHRKCMKCLNIKTLNEFYSKSNARCNSWCKDCFNKGTYQYQKDRALIRKLELVKKFGGKCAKCSYKTNLAALTFHHTDENLKLFELDARSIGNRSQKEIDNEASKCVLLCHNCHMELHWPHFSNLL